MDTNDLTVTDNREERRFEVELEDKKAFIEYTDDGDVVTMTHTEVPASFEGKGVGSYLVKGALESVKSDGKKVNPACAFVAAYIKKHAEYKHLVA
ncbi:MAG: GNAT family N-acetyltransferase [Pyrinomonadaceae bacterium]